MVIVKFVFIFVNLIIALLISSCDLNVTVSSFLNSEEGTPPQEEEKQPEKVFIGFTSQTSIGSENTNHIVEIKLTDKDNNLKSFNQDIKVTLSVTGDAIRDTDYTLTANEIIIPQGVSSFPLSISLIDNSVGEEADKNLIIDLVSVEGAELGNDLQHSVTIYDDDLVVRPTFLINGVNWSDTIASIDPLTRYSKITSADLFPNDAPAENFNFINGGELRRVHVKNKTSCQGLELIDSENAFNWKCFVKDGRVFFNSMGFNKGKGLSHLILANGTGWKSMKVQLKQNGQVIKESLSSPWWSDPISILNSGNINSTLGAPRLDLSNANTIYVVTEDISSRGININADGISLVTLPGVTLTGSSTLTDIDCRPFSPSGVQSCFIWFKDKKRIWVEGSISLLSARTVLAFDRISSISYPEEVRIHNLKLSGPTATLGILYGSTSRFFISDTTISNIGAGIDINYGWYSIYHDVTIEGVSTLGFDFGWLSVASRALNIHINNSRSTDGTLPALKASGQDSIISHFSVTNSNLGLYTEGVRGGLFDGIISSNNLYGIMGDYFSLNHLTVANNSGPGIYSLDGYKILNNILTVNNSTGLEIVNSSGHTIYAYNVSSLDNHTREIFFNNNASYFKWVGDVRLGRTANRCVYGTGVLNVGMSGINCEASDTSQFTRTLDINSNTLFRGYRTDTVNPLGGAGVTGALFASILDWFSFDNHLSQWTKLDINPLPNVSLSGPCLTGNTCGIFDWSLISTSYNLDKIHGEFVENQACPQVTRGSQAIKYFYGANEYPFLQGAIEYILDGYGNDNGYCEANEKCYFAPANGAQLREPWNFTKTCIYDPDGSTLTGITIYGE